MRSFYFYCILLAMFLFASCSNDENLDNNFTLTGCIVSSPHNTPVSNCVVEVTNGNAALASTITNEDGLFELTVDRDLLDGTHYLSIYDNQYGNKKQEKIQGVGMSAYDYGDIILFDIRNPYSLPTFNYQNYTYVVHPVLRREYALSELNNALDNVHDFGFEEWFLPNEMEFRKIISMIVANGTMYGLIPSGLYWTSDFDGKYTKYIFYSVGKPPTVEIGGSSNPSQMAGIVPISRY